MARALFGKLFGTDHPRLGRRASGAQQSVRRTVGRTLASAPPDARVRSRSAKHASTAHVTFLFVPDIPNVVADDAVTCNLQDSHWRPMCGASTYRSAGCRIADPAARPASRRPARRNTGRMRARHPDPPFRKAVQWRQTQTRIGCARAVVDCAATKFDARPGHGLVRRPFATHVPCRSPEACGDWRKDGSGSLRAPSFAVSFPKYNIGHSWAEAQPEERESHGNGDSRPSGAAILVPKLAEFPAGQNVAGLSRRSGTVPAGRPRHSEHIGRGQVAEHLLRTRPSGPGPPTPASRSPA